MKIFKKIKESIGEEAKKKSIDFMLKNANKIVLKDRLEQLLVEQKRQNSNCTLAEEIDFQAYNDYILGDFLLDYPRYLTGTSREREGARESIISEAISRTNAKTVQARRRVTKMISSALSITKKTCSKKYSRENELLTAEIEDRVIAANEEQTGEILEAIDNKVQQIVKSSSNDASRLIRQGNFDEALLEERAHRCRIDNEHQLYPDYGYDIKKLDGKDAWVSAPRTPEAAINYPPSFKGSCTISIDGVPVSNNMDPFEFAYNHQKTLTVKIIDAVHLLGDTVDPVQSEAEVFKKQTFEIKPPPLPQNIPCKIMRDNETILEYIRFSIDEIFEDGSFRISNASDPVDAIIITFQTKNRESNDFSIRRIGKDIKTLLRFEEIVNSFCKDGIYKIIRLDTGDIIGQGSMDPEPEADEDFTREERIQFFRDLILIKEYIGQELMISREIVIQEYNIVKYVAKLIREKRNQFEFRDTEFSFTVNEQLRQKILSADETPKRFVYVGGISCSFMGNKFSIHQIRTYAPVVIDDLQRLKNKMNVLDDGDTIKIKIIAAKDTQVYTVDMIPESEEFVDKSPALYVADMPLLEEQ